MVDYNVFRFVHSCIFFQEYVFPEYVFPEFVFLEFKCLPPPGITAVVQRRFGFAEGSVELYAEKVAERGLCAVAQCESLRYKLLGGLAVRRACYGVLRFVMESGAKGCEVTVSGKLRGARAKAMKFKDGYMISSGAPKNDYIVGAVRHILMRQGTLGLHVKIMLDWDSTGKRGPKYPLPDIVKVHPPKEEETSGDRPFIGKD